MNNEHIPIDRRLIKGDSCVKVRTQMLIQCVKTFVAPGDPYIFLLHSISEIDAQNGAYPVFGGQANEIHRCRAAVDIGQCSGLPTILGKLLKQFNRGQQAVAQTEIAVRIKQHSTKALAVQMIRPMMEPKLHFPPCSSSFLLRMRAEVCPMPCRRRSSTTRYSDWRYTGSPMGSSKLRSLRAGLLISAEIGQAFMA